MSFCMYRKGTVMVVTDMMVVVVAAMIERKIWWLNHYGIDFNYSVNGMGQGPPPGFGWCFVIILHWRSGQAIQSHVMVHSIHDETKWLMGLEKGGYHCVVRLSLHTSGTFGVKTSRPPMVMWPKKEKCTTGIIQNRNVFQTPSSHWGGCNNIASGMYVLPRQPHRAARIPKLSCQMRSLSWGDTSRAASRILHNSSTKCRHSWTEPGPWCRVVLGIIPYLRSPQPFSWTATLIVSFMFVLQRTNWIFDNLFQMWYNWCAGHTLPQGVHASRENGVDPTTSSNSSCGYSLSPQTMPVYYHVQRNHFHLWCKKTSHKNKGKGQKEDVSSAILHI